ncbi:hypothetical protein WJX72_002302 [[Myrmecia] bisecta]|uniref:Cation efflux protein cytoplasmic domain-containing protein n=1 Tax=[Myrmecia] bisecta TaxID=41462 RepID=A0AAW1PVR9_9CHLO
MFRKSCIALLLLVAVAFQGTHGDNVAGAPAGTTGVVEQAPGCSPKFPVPLPLAFGVKDHDRARPLFDALENGFCAIYMDFIITDDGKLMVGANETQAATINKSLQDLYLSPLGAIVAKNKGHVYKGAKYLGSCRSVALYLDAHAIANSKLNTTQVFDAIHAGVEAVNKANNGTLFTRFTNDGITEGPVTAYLSGTRPPPEYVAALPMRLLGLNGNQTTVSDNKFNNTVYPLISLTILGSTSSLLNDAAPSITELSAVQTASVTSTVQKARSQGRKVRLTHLTPDAEATWKVLIGLKPDFVSTTKYEDMRKLILAEVNEYALLPAGMEKESLLGPDAGADKQYKEQLQWAFRASWLVNWFLLGAKAIAFVSTHSKAVLASLADSGVDLASQGVIAMAEHFMQRPSPEYPVGRARLEALGVIACACIMSIASIEVLQYAAFDLYSGLFQGSLPQLEAGVAMYAILGGGTLAKLILWIYCRRLQGSSDSMVALAEDHLNDVMSNLGAIATVTLAFRWRKGWWIDPVGAILIALVIIWRWTCMTYQQVKKVVGSAAPASFIEQVEQLAHEHHELVRVDCTRAYHFGARFNVEMEIVLPGDMTVTESHDIALALQHKIEALEEVERAFVHVDYQERDEPEHKVERTLLLGELQRQHSKRWGRRSEAGGPVTEAALHGAQELVEEPGRFGERTDTSGALMSTTSAPADMV